MIKMVALQGYQQLLAAFDKDNNMTRSSCPLICYGDEMHRPVA